MTQTYCRRGRYQAVPVLDAGLESRALLSVVGLTGHVSPMLLRQINPRDQPHSVQVSVFRPVTLAGYVTETAAVVPTISFRVVDQNGRDMPSGTIVPQFVPEKTPGPPNLFFFSKRFGLNRTILSGNTHGRHYTVLVTAQDADSTSTIAIPARAPAQQR